MTRAAAQPPVVPEQSETTLRRGIGILFALGGEDARAGGLGVTRIAELVGREKSQVSRTLKTLVECGALERDPQTLQYRLSWQFYALAARAGDQRLLEAAGPLLDRLVASLGETAHLSVLRGADVLTVSSRASGRVLSAVGWVGRTTPAYCTSSGRALLFDDDPVRLRARFAGVVFQRLASNTPTSVEDLQDRLAAARLAGYATVTDEHEPGLLGVAAPVRDARGRVLAAVNVSAPEFRLGARLDAAVSEVVDAAAELSASLGAPAGRR